MAYYGNSSTRSVKIDDIIRHAKSVRRGVKKSILIVDMPYGTYKTKLNAKKNALKIIKDTNCDGIKLEGGKAKADIVRYLVKNNINVMGHIGLLPQSIKNKKDFKVVGKNPKEEKKIIQDLKELENSGVFAVVLEGVKENLAKKIMDISKVPIIGIGASNACDGQILVLEDMLGFFDKVPKFAKKYLNLKNQIDKAVKKFSQDVRKRNFPNKKYVYR
jgi:3-methyl-2-oxobutanoate hydroxymethyltransferase